MPVTMGGVASGIDTDAIIDKLLNVEARPIRKLQAGKKKNVSRKEVLKVLSRHLKDLNSRAKELYGFRASYDDKKAISSNDSVVEVIASKKADKGIKKVQVLQVASIHKISTDPVEEKKKIPGGKLGIEVNDESYVIRFKGGKLSALRDRIDEVASKIVNTSYIKVSGNNYILTIGSKVSGEKGELKLKGDREFLKEIGLISGVKAGAKEGISLIFDRRYFTSYVGEKKIEKQDGSIEVGREGKTVKIKGLLWQEYTLPIETNVKKDTVLEFDFSYHKPKTEEERLPFKVELGPEAKINIKGIELKGYNISRIRILEKKKTKKKLESILGVGIVIFDKGKRIEKIYPVEKDVKGRQEIPIGKDFADKSISKVIFYCNDGITDFSGAKIATPIKDKGILEPKNVITKPDDAKLKIDGIKIVRSKNNGLNDVIKGVTLNLKKPSKDAVEIKIEPDTTRSVEKIHEFVKSFNSYLDYHIKLTKAERLEKPGDYKNRNYVKGPFVGDMMIIRLENNLKRTVNAAYSTRADKPIKLFSQMGVSSGEINSEWEAVKEGKLVIDEDLLMKTIQENPEGIKMFFGSDTDGDNKTDNGMAYSVVKALKPYVSSGKNVISTKIGLENESIKLANERIERQEEHLKVYEKKLRRKFGAMEKAISGVKMQQNWLDNQMGNKNKK